MSKNLDQIYEKLFEKYHTKKDFLFFEQECLDYKHIEKFVYNFCVANLRESFTERTLNTVFKNQNQNGVLASRYEEIINNQKYYVDTFTVDVENAIKQILFKSLKNSHLMDLIDCLKNNKDKKVLYFKFQTEEGEKHLTGNVGQHSYRVFSFVVNTIRKIIKEDGIDYAAIYYTVDKKEEKRNFAYSKIIKNENKIFEKMILDDKSDNEFVSVYYYDNILLNNKIQLENFLNYQKNILDELKK
jgi:hypothetical protein